MTILHSHHIIPKHMGGSDDPSNRETLTLKNHALAHKLLYEKYGKLEDKAAWKSLEGKTDESEKIRLELMQNKLKKLRKDPNWQKAVTQKTCETLAKLRKDPIWFENWTNKISKTLTGTKDSPETKKKKSVALKKVYADGSIVKNRKKIPTKILSENCKKNSKLMSDGRKNSKKWKKSVTNPEYCNKKRQQMLGRDNHWGDKVSQSKLNKPTKSTKSVTINDKFYVSIASASRYLDITARILSLKRQKYGDNFTI